jgi:aminobenzoyl-glutamate utilization protein B
MSIGEDGLTRRDLFEGAAMLAAASAAAAPLLAVPGAALADVTGPEGAAALPASVAQAESAVAALEAPILRLHREVWALAELSLVETKSFRVHLRELEAEGFRIVSTGTSGVPTAFVVEWSQGTGGPVLGYLPEYDALPGLGNAAVPRPAPADSGLTAGHGCGHSILGAGCTGGAMALKRMMQADGTPGTIRVYGCAAEETEGAKLYMARDGLFDDLDAALAWHPAPVAATGLISTSANAAIKVSFTGRTAHAGNSPWDGRSALKAAELFGAGLQYMREHIRPTARLHYVYESAGVAPNIVPDEAGIWLVFRGIDSDEVRDLVAWGREIAEGAALMTQTRADYLVYKGMYEMQPNEPLARALLGHMTARPPAWRAEEQDFARACQREMGLPEAGLADVVMPFVGETAAGASSDLGDVSKITPLGVFGWPTMGIGTSLHTWAVTACGGTTIGDRASLDTARILAGIGHDLMRDADLRARVRADFEARGGGKPFVSLLPPEQRSPIGIPDWLRKSDDDEITAPLDVAL